MIQRNPRNGWRGYFRLDPEYPDELCCVGCLQRFLLQYGIPPERFGTQEDGEGFIYCDFYNESDLIANGWNEAETLPGDPDIIRARCIEHIEAGSLVILDQGATGIGSGPYSVTVWTKHALENGEEEA